MKEQTSATFSSQIVFDTFMLSIEKNKKDEVYVPGLVTRL